MRVIDMGAALAKNYFQERDFEKLRDHFVYRRYFQFPLEIAITSGLVTVVGIVNGDGTGTIWSHSPEDAMVSAFKVTVTDAGGRTEEFDCRASDIRRVQ